MGTAQLCQMLRESAVGIESVSRNQRLSCSTADKLEVIALRLRTAEKEIQADAQMAGGKG